jgi:hypothetical protein
MSLPTCKKNSYVDSTMRCFLMPEEIENSKEHRVIPDNSVVPEIRTVRDYFRFRERMERLAEFYGSPLVVKDEQGLPNIRREILRRAH